MSRCPSSHAANNGVLPPWFAESAGAPLARSRRTASVLPHSAAVSLCVNVRTGLDQHACCLECAPVVTTVLWRCLQDVVECGSARTGLPLVHVDTLVDQSAEVGNVALVSGGEEPAVACLFPLSQERRRSRLRCLIAPIGCNRLDERPYR
jgi:hypothetical protein